MTVLVKFAASPELTERLKQLTGEKTASKAFQKAACAYAHANSDKKKKPAPSAG